MGLSTTSIITTLLLSPIIRAQDGGDTCYYPGGSIASSDVPCYPGGGICCTHVDECLDNGLCSFPGSNSIDPYFTRNSCTDPEWGSDICGDICTYNEGDWEYLLQCVENMWCCNGNYDQYDCCASSANLPDGTDYFSLPAGKPINLTTSTASASKSTAAADSSPSQAQNNSLSTGTIVGITALFILAVIILFSLWRRRKRRPTAAFDPLPASAPLEAKFSDATSPGTNVSELHDTPVALSDLPATEVSPPSSWRGSMGAVPGAGSAAPPSSLEYGYHRVHSDHNRNPNTKKHLH